LYEHGTPEHSYQKTGCLELKKQPVKPWNKINRYGTDQINLLKFLIIPGIKKA